MVSLNPVQIMKSEAEEERSEIARLSSFVGAIAIGDLVKSTLGPRGMDKILVSAGRQEGHIEVTNDGATILRNIGVDNPAAKILVNISKIQDEEVGDGTTSVVVLAAELLREAEKLISNSKLHPQTVIAGFRRATDVARKALEAVAVDNSADEEVFKSDLFKIALTTLSSKILSQHKDFYADMCVRAVLRLKKSGNLDAIKIIKKQGGTLTDAFLDEGFILEKSIGVNQPKRIENAKILIANTPMDTDKIKVFNSSVVVDSTAKIAEIEVAEKEKMKEKVDKIIKHGINVFINRQLIYNYPEQLFADAGVMAIEHADFDGMERLALVTGGEIVSTFNSPELVTLGSCDLIEEVQIGEERMIRFSGCSKGEACTIVLRGATKQILDEADRSVHDALCVLTQTVKEPRVVYGGGCCEVIMASAIREALKTVSGKEVLAMEAFASALDMIPTIIADNAGFDSAELLANLKAAHAKPDTVSCKTAQHNAMGLDMDSGCVNSMHNLSIFESYQVKRQVLVSASEAAEMILRVDDIIRAAPRKRQEDRSHC